MTDLPYMLLERLAGMPGREIGDVILTELTNLDNARGAYTYGGFNFGRD